MEHALDCCLGCHYRLQGHSLDYTREMLELPEPQPIAVIEHRIIKRFCPHCRRWHSPKLELNGVVLGQGRIGVPIVSLIAYLRSSLRRPIRRIQAYLASLHQLFLSTGELVEVLHQVRQPVQTDSDALKTPFSRQPDPAWRRNLLARKRREWLYLGLRYARRAGRAPLCV